MSIKRNSLPKTYFSGLDYNNIVKDIRNLVKDHPDYNNSWDDFLNSNAGTMITSLFAMITDQLASRIDMSVDELLIDTFTKKGSAIKLLKLIGYTFSLPNAARVNVLIESDDVSTGEIVIKNEYIKGDKSSFSTKSLFAINKDGDQIPFEALKYDSIRDEYDYFSSIVVDINDDEGIDFFHGTTKIKDVEVTEDSGFVVELNETPLDEKSIQVFMLDEEGKEQKLLKVENFIISDAQNNDTPIPWSLEVNENDTAKIVFGSNNILINPDKRPSIGSKLRIFYRVGGGIEANINRNAINITEELLVQDEPYNVTFINKEEGIGGTNSETAEHAAYHGPRVSRTAGKTVTVEDYESVLNSNINILKNKTYGADNIPSNYRDKYGLFLNPLEVLSFVLMKKPGYKDIHTKDYYNANWGTLNLENRFNGLYGFFDSNFGEEVNIERSKIKFESDQGILITEDDIYYPRNYVILNTSNEFKDSLINEDYSSDPDVITPNENFQGSITLTKFDKSIHNLITDLEDDFFGYLNNYFYGNQNLNNVNAQIYENINAYVYSRRLPNEIPLVSNENKFILSFDTLGEDAEYKVTIDLGEIDNSIPEYVTPEELRDYINSMVSQAYNSINPYQDFGMFISDETDEGDYAEIIENLDEDVYKLVIFDGTQENTYDIDLGTVQTWNNFIDEINSKINPDNFEVNLIQARENIACKDIRIEYVGTDGKGVEFRNYVNPNIDIFDLLGINIEESNPITNIDYTEVASIELDDNNKKYLKITSPTKGSSSLINLERHPESDCVNRLYGNYLDTNQENYYSYGQRRAVIILESDPDENNFGNILFENGTCFNSPFEKDTVFLNYIKSKKDTIELGTYFYNEFDLSDPRHKPIDFSIYNSYYEFDEINQEYYIDFDKSDILLYFSKEEERQINSIWKMSSDLDGYLGLKKSTGVYSETVSLTDSVFKDKSIKIKTEIDSYSFNFGTSVTLNEVVNEIENAISEISVNLSDNKINFTSENYKDGIIEFKYIDNTCHHLLFDLEDEFEEIKFVVDGDYYLEYDKDLTPRGGILMKLTNKSGNIPQYKFYIHYLSDRRFDFELSDMEKFETDEDYLKEFLNPYKIAGVENTFKLPKFSTFDIKATVVCYSNYSVDNVKERLFNNFYERYSIDNMQISENINKSEVIKLGMNTEGVRYFDLKYFGKNLLDEDTNQNEKIISDFDEILVLSDEFISNGIIYHGLSLELTRG